MSAYCLVEELLKVRIILSPNCWVWPSFIRSGEMAALKM
jgi:hypothetical protein